MSSNEPSSKKPVPELDLSELAFLFADIVSTEHPVFKKITWSALGSAADEIKAGIADQNIDLEEPEMSVDIYAIQSQKQSAAVVDVNYGGGGTGPDPFRFVYFVSDGKYIGKAGFVAS